MELNQEQKSFGEKRIREITLAYYSREDVREAMANFSHNRECIPRYFESFGKRPNAIQYQSDILEQVKRGATSFHCSEELWSDPLEIATGLSKQELDELRTGWDLILDVDSPYIEYSKIYSKKLIETLEFYGIKNIGVKFSGNKGFHIIIPWEAFPEEVYGQKTKDMFPEWPRIICQYLGEIIKPKLEEEILKNDSLKELAKKTGKKESDLIIKECVSCNRPAIKKYLLIWICPVCKNEIVNLEGTYNNRKKSKCPECRKDLIEKSKKEIFHCEFCNKNSKKNPELFEEKERFATEKLIDADLILVSPRHLFRMPYSLHEKTALASIVISPEEIKNFQIKDANPFKVKIKDFSPKSIKEEAKNILLQSLDWKEQKDRHEKKIRKNTNNSIPAKHQKIQIQNPTEDIFPPCIKLILAGIQDDGRKRALFILINFLKSLGLNESEIENRIYKWNEKNYKPLKKGYIKAQLEWYKKNNSTVLPPNCDKSNYRDLNLCKPEELCRKIKNPLNYSIKKNFRKN